VSSYLGIVRFELRYYLRRISTWVYFAIFLASAFLIIHLAGGAWESVQMAVSGSGGNVKVNSPYVIAGLTATLGLFGVLVTAALLGNAVFRDYETGIHPLFFTTPVSRASYLGGRFTGAILVNAFIFASIPLGLMLGCAMPYLDAERFGAFRLATFVQPYLLFLLPNLVLTGAIFFALAALTRRMLPNYIGGVFLLIGYLISSEYLGQMENQRLAAILDPFGLGAFSVLTKYWTPAQQNTQVVPLAGPMLLNRVVWLAVGLAIFAACFARFRFTHHAPERRRARGAASAEAAEPPRGPVVFPALHPEYGARAQIQQFLSILRRSFRGIVGNRYFFAIVGGGVLFMVLTAGQANKLYGTTTWPVTYAVLDVLGSTFGLFLIIVVSFYTGELVWAERDVKLNQVVDATPMRNWVPLAAKWSSLALMVVLLQVTVLVTGVILQTWKGYYNFEIGLYVKELLGLALINYLIFSVLVMLIHVTVNHKYMGHLLVIGFLIVSRLLPAMGLEHGLYRFNSGSAGLYSDMNRFGPFLTPFFWFKAYWAAWVLLFAVLSNLFWVRGEEGGARWRVRLARLRFTRPAISAAALAGLLIVGLGGFVFYNTNILNDYRTSYQSEEARARYERMYKRFENAPQPRIVGVKVDAEIYPERGDITFAGRLRLRNRTAVEIDSVIVELPTRVEIRKVGFTRPATRVLSDEESGFYIYRLARPLQPGDSVGLDFDLAYLNHGFTNGSPNTSVVENGTFVNNTLLPAIGYSAQGELSSDDVRRKHHLKPKERMAPATDLAARRNNYISTDADWVDFEATVGTSADQIAIAPGYLQKEWRKGDRRYFQYRMDAPILNFVSFLSARYAVKRDHWKDVAIEVYYHPGHEYNLDRMIDGVKKSLDYYTTNFGPYQHRQVRILEFPRYASFAQSFPNTIPYSEAIGFIARVEDPKKDIDYPYYVTAHEVAHQWWAHQVIGANVQGSTLLSESLAEYSALMVMEKEYGARQMHRFLKYDLDQYLRGRATERKKEQPLLKVEDQQYIHYYKGAMAFYALRDYIGEDRLNSALRAFLDRVKFQQPPYTTSLELYSELQRVTPDSLQYVLRDLFEEITLYDNRAKEATSTKRPDGKYEVTLKLEAAKLRADSLGSEAPVPMNDLVDVGVFAANPKDGKELGAPLYLRKQRVRSGDATLRIVVDQPPARAGIDPYHKLIDRNSDDNTVAVK
jgi:ABC-type transport system involved in multi-copper enzyme maturation permease subunit